MTQFVSKLHALPMNIVVNVHVKDKTTGEDDSKVTTTDPKLKGDLKDQIAAEFDLVGYMGTYWEAEKGERVQKRGIQWHPDPTKPVLKDRSGQLPKWTNVAFHTDDYDNLFSTLIGHLDSLEASKTLDSYETDPVVTAGVVKAPVKGGPVASPAPSATPVPRKAAKAAPAAAKPAPAAAVSAPPATPTPVGNVTLEPPSTPTVPAPVPVATRPVVPAAARPQIPGADPVPVQAQAVEDVDTPAVLTSAADSPSEPVSDQPMTPEAVADALGGEVMPNAPVADDSPTGEPVEQAAEAVVDVVEAEMQAMFCGTGFEGQDPQAEGCGVQIVTQEQGGEASSMQVEIAQLKTKTNLCPACFAAWRAANKKGA